MNAISNAARDIAHHLTDLTAPLRARIEELEEENAYLRSELGMNATEGNIVAILRRWPSLTRSHAHLLIGLYYARNRFLTLEQIEAILPKRDHILDRDASVVKVRVSQTRKAVGFHAIGIIWGRGHTLTEEGVSLVREALSEVRTA